MMKKMVMKKKPLAKRLSFVIFLTVLFPQLSLAHSTGSVMSQVIHSFLHAHHLFGGLLLLALFVVCFMLKRKRVKKSSM